MFNTSDEMSTNIVLAMRAEKAEKARKAKEAGASEDKDTDPLPTKLMIGDDMLAGSVGSFGQTRGRLHSFAESITESIGKVVEKVKSIPRHRIVLFCVLGIIFAAMFVLFHVLPVAKYLLVANTWLKQQDGVGVLVLICGTIVWICLCLPSVMVEILCAATYGFWPAFAYLSIIKTTAAALVFAIGLKTGREIVHRHFFSKSAVLRATEKALSGGGIKSILLVQLVPLPFGIKGYMLSVSGVRFDYYMLTALLVEIPYNFASAYIGSAAGDLATAMDGDTHLDSVQIAVMVCGGLGVVISMVGLHHYVKKELRKLKKVEKVEKVEKEMDSDTDSDEEQATPRRGHASNLSSEALRAHLAQEPEIDWQEKIAMYEKSGGLTPRSAARAAISDRGGAEEEKTPQQPSPWAKPPPAGPIRSPQAACPDDGNGEEGGDEAPLDMSL
jgi:uncharacterized membrane protein YdjX (TVP38/TMEM64 family)